MIRADVVKFIDSQGWKIWGKFRMYGDSHYQCFRKGNNYLWLGNYFLEKSDKPLALDFVNSNKKTVCKFLETA
jgi:hypothetical protein